MKALLALIGVVAAASSSGGVTMGTPRAVHTATLLESGEVLIAGGCAADGCELDERGRTTEIYDPDTGRFRAGPPLLRARVGHAAVRLGDGSVLVVGGWDVSQATATAELYEPGRGFSRLPSMTTPRGGFTATPPRRPRLDRGRDRRRKPDPA